MQPIRERILKQSCEVKRNKTIGDDLYTLMTTLNRDGIKHYFSVGRLVYNAFVSRLDLNDRSIRISYRDGNGKNLHFSNLIAKTLSALRKDSYSNGRSENHLSEEVSQFHADGKYIRSYMSMTEAAIVTGFAASGISAVGLGRQTVYKGFIWQKGNEKQLKVSADIFTRSDSDDSRIKNLPDERWLPFPGYEGLYEISDYGRVKSMSRLSQGKVQRRHSETIKQLTEGKRAPGSKTPGTMIVTLCKNHKKKTLSVARYVYLLFVNQFEIQNSLKRIHYKDGDSKNLHFLNLELKDAIDSVNRKYGNQFKNICFY